jgi:hypothetical protein
MTIYWGPTGIVRLLNHGYGLIPPLLGCSNLVFLIVPAVHYGTDILDILQYHFRA